MSTYISCADTAKLIRKALKENFPGVKFSVRSDTYSGGASIDVKWLDGPAAPSVEEVVIQFKGATFDGMTDMKSYHTSSLNGEEVHFGADFVFCKRSLSRTFIDTIVPQFCKKYGVNSDRIHIEDSYDGKSADVVFHSDYWDETRLHEILYATGSEDAHRAYEAQEDAEARRQAEWKAGAEERARKAEEDRKCYEAEQKARQEQEKRDQERRQREQAEQEQRNRAQRQRDGLKVQQRVVLSSKYTALAYLGLVPAASQSDITKAFRKKVRAMSDGKGGYTGDMDFLVQVKEKALG